MVDTFKMMNQIRTINSKHLTDIELITRWKQREDATVIAELFCRHFGMYNKVATSTKFAYLDFADKVSYVLQGLYNALQNYDITKNIKFITFSTKCVYISLVAEVVKAHAKGKWNSKNNVSLDDLKEKADTGENFEFFYDIYTEDSMSSDIVLDIIRSYNLTGRQLSVCLELMQDYRCTDIELAEKLGVHRHTVRKEKLAIKDKLKPIYNY